jgi:regulator of sigma E protease
MSYFLVILTLGLTILIHELGHFIAAKLYDIPIGIFSIGFGPKLFSRVKGGTEYRISLIPIGGYVLPDIQDESDFYKIAQGKRIAMTFGGPLASLLLTIICFILISIFTFDLSFQNIIIKPLQYTASSVFDFIMIIPSLFVHTEKLSGIVGIVSQSSQFVTMDAIGILNFTALLSLNLFVLNMIPIPVLDGGKIVLYASEKLHPKFTKLHFPLAVTGWIFMLGLMLYITVLDIMKLLV